MQKGGFLDILNHFGLHSPFRRVGFLLIVLAVLYIGSKILFAFIY